MNNQYAKYIKELDELVQDSLEVEKLETTSKTGYKIIIVADRVQKLFMNSIQIIKLIFREGSDLYREIVRIKDHESKQYASTIRKCKRCNSKRLLN